MTFPDCFFIVDKPSGVTSFSMVSLVRRLTGVRRVGHAGTLDPLASGVLPIAVGQATRVIEYLDDATKTYAATLRLGVETDTHDADGKIVAESDASAVTAADVERVLGRFLGDIQQVPPAYSAIKVAGKPLYRYAREGQPVEVRPRSVHVYSIRLMAFEPGTAATAEVEVVCSKGTYIRSIAHDLGRALECGAHLIALRRTSSGGFDIDAAVTPDALVALAGEDRLDDVILSVDRAVEGKKAAIVAGLHAADVRSGRSVAFESHSAGAAAGASEICRVYDTDGRFLGILEARGSGVWHPAKVLLPA